MTNHDVIVLGVGGVGAAALSNLARRGARVLGLDRFPPAHDRGSSHGRSRLIRRAYYEHPAYVPLVERAFGLWRELEERRHESLLVEVGLLQIGPPDGDVLRGVMASARRHALPVESLTEEEISRLFPDFAVPVGLCGAYEAAAGILAVEDCVRAHIDDALAHGGELRTGETVKRWRCRGDTVEVETDAGLFRSARLVIAAGAWAGGLLADLGIELSVLRKPQYWYSVAGGEYALRSGRPAPAFLYELRDGVFYGFPSTDGKSMKVAEHSNGRPVDDPLALDRSLDEQDRGRVESFAARCLPRLSRELVDHSVCMYTMTRDAHFVIDKHPEHPQVCFAAGLSGHGFKFSPVLGEALADLALQGRTELPIDFLNCRRPSLRPS